MHELKNNIRKNRKGTYTESELLAMLKSVNDNLKIAIERMKGANNLSKDKYNLKNNK